MSTILGVETPAGAVLAGDTRQTEDGTVVGEDDYRTCDFEVAVAAAVGEPARVQEFRRRLEAEIDQYRDQRDTEPGVSVVARSAARVAESEGIEAIVAARNDDSIPEIRAIDSNGAILEDDAVAFGTGAGPAFGRLEGEQFTDDLSATVDAVEAILRDVAERDPETGTEVDVVTLATR